MPYDDLVKRLRAAAIMSEALSIFLPHSEGSAVSKLYNEAADAIEELSKKYLASEVDNTNLTGWLAEEHAKHLWIPVTERLPENNVHVLLACKTGFGNAYVCDGFHTEKYSTPTEFYDDIDADYDEETDEYYFPEGWWEVIKNLGDYSCVAIEDKVTHWMPLPEPPKEGKA